MKNAWKYIITLVMMAVAPAAFAWTYNDCVAVSFKHPDCRQYDRGGRGDHQQPNSNEATAYGGTGGTAYGGTGGAGGTGGTGFGGYADANSAANAWSNLSQSQRAELSASLTSQQRTELMNAINNSNSNNARLSNNSPSSSSAQSQGNVGGGASVSDQSTTNVRYSYPIQLPYIGLPTTVTPSAAMTTIVGSCSPIRRKLGVGRNVKATEIGFFTNTQWDNARVEEVVIETTEDGKPAPIRATDWSVVGSDTNGNPIEQRMIHGQQLIIIPHIMNASAAKTLGIGGVGTSGNGGSGGAGASGSVQAYGRDLLLEECIIPERRTVYLPKPQAQVVPQVRGDVHERDQELSSVATEQVRTFERAQWACWYGDPKLKPEKTDKGVPVRQCTPPRGLVVGERVTPLVPEMMERVVGGGEERRTTRTTRSRTTPPVRAETVPVPPITPK